ncbi:MAG TPA: hypothetical protein PKI21_08070, partial [Nitrospira sp.]|nr:hypothetical protein [Nitrospira sp.]
MRSSLRPVHRLHPQRWALFLLSLACLCVIALWTPNTHAAEESSSPDLTSQVWQYLTTQDSEQANSTLTSIMQRPDATLQAVQDILRKGQPHGLQPVGLLADEQVVVRDRPYRVSLSIPQSYEPTKDYALVVCLHGAGFTGEAYLDRWKSRLGEQYILACPTYPAGAWFTRRAEDL